MIIIASVNTLRFGAFYDLINEAELEQPPEISFEVLTQDRMHLEVRQSHYQVSLLFIHLADTQFTHTVVGAPINGDILQYNRRQAYRIHTNPDQEREFWCDIAHVSQTGFAQIKNVPDNTQRKHAKAHRIPTHILDIAILQWIPQASKCRLYLMKTRSAVTAFDKGSISVQGGATNPAIESYYFLEFNPGYHLNAASNVNWFDSVDTMIAI
jgi:hypothetical protein